MLGAIAVAPLAWFGALYLNEFNRAMQLATVVRDAVALPKLANPPRTLVAHGARADWQDKLVEMGALDEVYVTWNNKTTRVANARRAACDRPPRHLRNVMRARMAYLVCATETPAASYPRDGLHFFISQPGSTGKRADWQAEYELKWIEGGSERRIGYFGRLRTYTPNFPPVVSSAGFDISYGTSEIVPWYGELPFLIERFGLKPESLVPAGQPSPDEVRNEFLRRRESTLRIDQAAAGGIAIAVGNSVLSADDIAPVLKANVIEDNFARGLGHEEFCNRVDRLCDFQESLVSACKAQNADRPVSGGYRDAALRRCERIPDMCQFCRTAQRCEADRTGQTAGCSRKETAARHEALRPLREKQDSECRVITPGSAPRRRPSGSCNPSASRAF